MTLFESWKINEFWYLVGLITSDGSLSKDGRHIAITSKDSDILQEIVVRLKLKIKVNIKYSGSKSNTEYYVIQIGNTSLYKYLEGIGLTKAKSLTLENLVIPNNYFIDFLRGMIDGDGCIFIWFNPYNHNLQASLRICSASKRFSFWLFEYIKNYFRVPGQIIEYPGKKGKHTIYNLKYGKLAAEEILKQCYYNDALANQRKLNQVKSLLNINSKVRGYRPRWRNW